MGFSTESRNYTRLVATAAYGSTNSSTRGLASDLFKNMVDNGFKLIYHNGGGPAAPDITNLWKATEVIFEPKSPTDDAINFVDPLGATQKWRVGFSVQGYPNTAGDGNQLMAYLGTPATLSDTTGIDRVNSFPVVMLEGGSLAGDTRITATKVHGYRISITNRGVAIVVWNPKNIEDMKTMGLLCIQRPVKSDGSTLTDGFAPVFAVHNTDPMSGGRPRQSGRFFRTTVRERDVNLPQRPTDAVLKSKRHATGAIQFRSLTSQAGPVRHIFVINGVTVWLGTGQTPPTNHLNDVVYIATAPTAGGDPLEMTAKYYAQKLTESNQQGLKDLDITYSGPNILFYAKKEGVDGNNIIFKKSTGDGKGSGNYDATNTYTIISPDNGTFSGGGGKPNAAKGTIKFTNKPSVGPTGNITLGTGGGVTFNFTIGQPVGAALESAQGNSATEAAKNLLNRLRALQMSYNQLQGVKFTIDANQQDTIIVENDSLSSPSLWSMSAQEPNIVITAMAGGNTNYASGKVNFNSIPPSGSVLRLNGIDIKFVDGYPTGDSEVGLGDILSPFTGDQVLQALLAKLSVHPRDEIQAARYDLVLSANAPQGTIGQLLIQYASPGVEGNEYTLYTTTTEIAFESVGPGFMTSLAGGAGYSALADLSSYPDEISEPTGMYGASMYRFPNIWNAPVTTDTGEYVLVFPFGFCTEKVSYTEEMDMIAVSKGAAYQGVQNVNINVYGANRTYTSYNSNAGSVKAPDNYVRIFLLTSGGGI